MFQAKGCPVWGSKEKNLTPLLKDLVKEKNLVFNLTDSEVEAPAEVTVVKTSLSLDNFSCGVDVIMENVRKENEKTNCIFVADSFEQSVSGMVIAAIVKSMQTLVKMKDMVVEGISDKDWMAKLIHKSFEEDTGEPIDQYDVVESLVNKLERGKLGKILADKIVDLCDEKVNLRNCIKSLKEKYDSNGEAAEVKTATIEALERYFYAVCVGIYARSIGEEGYSVKFSQWLKDSNFIEAMIPNGIRFWQDMTFFSLAPSVAQSPPPAAAAADTAAPVPPTPA